MKVQPKDISIKYVPGPNIPVADALGRVSPHGKVEIKGLDDTIHKLTPQLIRVQVQTILKETKEDTTSSSLCSRWYKLGLERDAENCLRS